MATEGTFKARSDILAPTSYNAPFIIVLVDDISFESSLVVFFTSFICSISFEASSSLALSSICEAHCKTPLLFVYPPVAHHFRQQLLKDLFY